MTKTSQKVSQRVSKYLLPIAILTLMSLIAACAGNERSAYADIDPVGWAYGDTLVLKPGVSADTTDTVPAMYDMSIVVRHNNNYRYSNLWLETRYVIGDSVHIDTVNVHLADEYGKWYGHGVGISYQLSQPILSQRSIRMDRSISVSHIMRDDTLADIEQIGVILSPSIIN